MTQIYSDNCYTSSNNPGTDMTLIEQNFAALKSSFSGATAPSNIVAGMWWHDTTANILRHRNEANTAWLDVWDLANNKPFIANLLGEITLAMMATAATNPAAGSGGLRSLGTSGVHACAGNDARLSDERVPIASSCSQSKLKTTTGSVSTYGANGTYQHSGSLPGGEYGFRVVTSKSVQGAANFRGYYGGTGASYAAPGVEFYHSGTQYGSGFAQERYVQSSGEVHWIFSLRNRETGIVEKSWQAPDHCCFGNGDDPEYFQHPYGDYDQDKYELIVINPPLDVARRIHSRAGKRGEFLEVINQEYSIDELSSPPWPRKAVTVGLPGDWEDAWLDQKPVKTIKSTIPKPKQAVTRVLKRKI